MNYRKLGKWGLKISEVSLGSWMTRLASEQQVTAAQEVVNFAYENGINFFDCADAYSGGEAERFLGRCLAPFRRSSLVISSKVYFPVGDGPNDRGLSRKHIFEQIDASLKNLQTDYLDLYFCHRYDQETPLEETLQAMSDLVTQGKVLYYGVSEWTAPQLLEALRIIEEKGLHPLSVIQPQYNMFDRYIEEREITDICKAHGIGVVAFSPLAQGLLTGKYRKGQGIPEGSRATYQSDRQVNRLLTEENLEIVEKLLPLARQQGCSLSALALAWALREPVVSSVICGASRAQQLAQNIEAANVTLPAEMLEEIDRIFGFSKSVRKIG